MSLMLGQRQVISLSFTGNMPEGGGKIIFEEERMLLAFTGLCMGRSGDCAQFSVSIGSKDKEKRRLVAQLCHLDSNYAGGLPGYIRNAKKLLKDAQDGDTLNLQPLVLEQ